LSHDPPLAINILMTSPTRCLILTLVLAVISIPAAVIAGPRTGVVGPMQRATPVVLTGKVLSYEGQPLANREIHFENVVSGDVFLGMTGPDGSFSMPLPPGFYNLREGNGPIVAGYILAQGDAINVGSVSEPPELQRLLEMQGVAPAQVHSPAPITSDVRPGNRVEPIGSAPLR
jgi:hypothetical protein